MVRVVTLDWLSNLQLTEPEPYWFRDERLYAGINSARFEDNANWAEFEKYMGLPSAPDEPSNDVLARYTSELKQDVLGLHSSEQLNLSIDRSELRYLIRRLRHFNHEKSPQQYLNEAPGLDILSKGIIALHEYAKFCGQSLDWQAALENVATLDKLAELDYAGFARTDWSRCDLLPDAAAEYQSKPLLHELRHSFISLQHPVLTKICEGLWRNEEYISITNNFVREETGCTKREASRYSEELSMLMTEKCIPEIATLGLRYRCILTANLRPRIWNGGLVRAYEVANSNYPGFFLYVEPRDSNGPRKGVLQENAFHFTATRGVLSFRLDMWDGKNWVFEPWKPKNQAIDGRKERWLLKEFNIEEKNNALTPREAVLLGILWSHRGDESSRRDLLELLEFPVRSARHYREKLEKKRAFQICQHPKLCFSGLSDAILLAVTGYDDIEDLRDYILSLAPYCVIYFNKQEDSLWGLMRVPRWRSDLLRELMIECIGKDTPQYQVGRILEENRYAMTLTSRLHDDSSGCFANPWT
ncbi:MAG: hypothetical protein ACOC38_02660 [Promethearchaeia archaeon]